MLSGQALACDQGEEIESSLIVASGVEGDGAGGPGLVGVAWVIIFKNLRIRTKLNSQIVIIWCRSAGHDGQWAHGCQDAVFCCELVQTGVGVFNGSTYHDFW